MIPWSAASSAIPRPAVSEKNGFLTYLAFRCWRRVVIRVWCRCSNQISTAETPTRAVVCRCSSRRSKLIAQNLRRNSSLLHRTPQNEPTAGTAVLWSIWTSRYNPLCRRCCAPASAHACWSPLCSSRAGLRPPGPVPDRPSGALISPSSCPGSSGRSTGEGPSTARSGVGSRLSVSHSLSRIRYEPLTSWTALFFHY